MTDNSTRSNRSHFRDLFEVVATVIMLGLAAALVWQGRGRFSETASARSPIPDTPVPTAPVAIDALWSVGSGSASVAMIEFADFECSACRQFEKDVRPALMRDYVSTGRIRFVFKNFPLIMHIKGTVATTAALCAARQGKSWPMHDWLFALPDNIDDSHLQSPSATIGLDVDAYNSCRISESADKAMQAARSEGVELHVPATPTFFFGKITPDGKVKVTQTMTGYRSLDGFHDVLKRLLG